MFKLDIVVIFVLLLTTELSLGFFQLDSGKLNANIKSNQRSICKSRISKTEFAAQEFFSRRNDDDSISTKADATNLRIIRSSLAKMVISSALVYSLSSNLYNSPAEASTAPAAQAIALAEKNGGSIENLIPEEAPKVTRKSSARAIAVGLRLQALDAKMFGAFWCSHCNNQKQELGVQTVGLYKYIECDKDGANTDFKLCREKKIAGYPTWEINGNFYPGEKDIGELETLLSDIEVATVAAK